MGSNFKFVGQDRRRVDGRAKATGQTKFADDLNFSQMLFCKLLRSVHPHARIQKINVNKAKQLSGVKLVLTGKDFPIPYGILPVSQDEHALCQDKVRFVGDPVVAIIARDEFIAEEALDLIEVEYEPLPTVTNPEQALQDSESKIHEFTKQRNIHKTVNLQFGDVEKGFTEADHVFEDSFFYEGNTHLPIEQHASVAALDQDGKLVLWSSTQTPHYVHRALAKVLELPASRVRIIATPNGGGFGGKSDPFHHEIVVAKAAMMTGQPVKICLNREEVFYCHRGRHPVLMQFKTGIKKDGRITAMHLKTLIDGGSYGSYGVASTFYTGALQTVTYKIPRYHFQGCRVFTNKPPCGPKRGHGTPQPRFGQEVQLDKIAEALKLNPYDFRKKILAEPESLTANYLHISTIGLRECLDQVVKGSAFQTRYQKLPKGKGLGLACSSYLSGAGLPIYWNAMPHSGVQLKLDRGGGITAFCGATEIGQGSDDVLAVIISEVLGIQPEDIRLVTGDTDLTPVDLGSYSSRVTLMMGNAAIEAAEKAKNFVAQAVAEKLKVDPKQIVFEQGKVFDSKNSDSAMSFSEAVVLAESKFGTIGTVGSYRPPESPGKYKGAGVGPSPTYSYSACVVEVNIDVETGWIHIPKIWIAHDIGQAINPVSAKGQVIGSVYMALGEALMEEQSFRKLPKRLSHALVHKNPSMLEYKSPTFLEMPEVETYLVEDPDKLGPFGAKEVGQGPLLPVMPALANAVYDAVGIRIDEIPITPEKILKGLELKAKGENPRIGPKGFPEVPWSKPMVVPPPWEGGDGKAVSTS